MTGLTCLTCPTKRRTARSGKIRALSSTVGWGIGHTSKWNYKPKSKKNAFFIEKGLEKVDYANYLITEMTSLLLLGKI